MKLHPKSALQIDCWKTWFTLFPKTVFVFPITTKKLLTWKVYILQVSITFATLALSRVLNFLWDFKFCKFFIFSTLILVPSVDLCPPTSWFLKNYPTLSLHKILKTLDRVKRPKVINTRGIYVPFMSVIFLVVIRNTYIDIYAGTRQSPRTKTT